MKSTPHILSKYVNRKSAYDMNPMIIFRRKLSTLPSVITAIRSISWTAEWTRYGFSLPIAPHRPTRKASSFESVRIDGKERPVRFRSQHIAAARLFVSVYLEQQRNRMRLRRRPESAAVRLPEEAFVAN